MIQSRQRKQYVFGQLVLILLFGVALEAFYSHRAHPVFDLEEVILHFDSPVLGRAQDAEVWVKELKKEKVFVKSLTQADQKVLSALLERRTVESERDCVGMSYPFLCIPYLKADTSEEFVLSIVDTSLASGMVRLAEKTLNRFPHFMKAPDSHLRAWFGVVQVALAPRQTSSAAKVAAIEKGFSILKEMIQARPEDYDLRFLRLKTMKSVPWFFQDRSVLKDDEEALVAAWKSLPASMQNRICSDESGLKLPCCKENRLNPHQK